MSRRELPKSFGKSSAGGSAEQRGSVASNRSSSTVRNDASFNYPPPPPPVMPTRGRSSLLLNMESFRISKASPLAARGSLRKTTASLISDEDEADEDEDESLEEDMKYISLKYGNFAGGLKPVAEGPTSSTRSLLDNESSHTISSRHNSHNESSASLHVDIDLTKPRSRLNSRDDDAVFANNSSNRAEHTMDSLLAEMPDLKRSPVSQKPVFPEVIPRDSMATERPSLGDRRISVVARLQKQGLKTDRDRSYAVRSIQRGSDDWAKLLKPFVSDLALRSVVRRHLHQREVTFRPYCCQAALLFVDLSGYSRITSAIAHRGAHAISDTVNAYLERILSVIHDNGGDVVKFAGDAIIVVWEGSLQELELNVFCAARAALELQVQAGEHPIDGTDLVFRIHCGLCCGTLVSEIFEAPKHENMQRLYHSLGGETMLEIGELAELSKAEETAISRNCFSFLEGSGQYEKIPGEMGAKLLVGLILEETLVEMMDIHIHKTMDKRAKYRAKIAGCIEEEFIHSSVLEALHHGGLSPTQIAQIRDLCVLFIAMTSHGDPINWLMEVQEILDANHCPIVQIIDDDKGVHIVAAINLYESVPESPLLGLKICRELSSKRVGAAVGLAAGPSFCGVTGSTEACRWDITGASVVRAARLMQYALRKGIDFAIDQSVYDDPMATTYMKVVDSSVLLKGTADPIAVYTISDSKQHFASRVMANVHGGVHNDKVQAIHDYVGARSRSAVLVTGSPLAGKKIVCQRAAGFCDLVPYLHVCDVSASFLDLARTIATWFQYVDDKEVKELARNVLVEMDKNRWTCAHDQCINLVNMALSRGFRACFVVDRVQFLDKFSLSLIRECLQPNRKRRGGSRSSSISSQISDSPVGKICFLCVHVPLYNSKSADDIVQDITRLDAMLNIHIIEINEAGKEELRTLFRDLADMAAEDRLLDAYAEASGYYAGYFIERVVGIQNFSTELCRAGQSALVETNNKFELQVPPGMVRINKELTVTQIRPEIAMRFSQVYDDLPPQAKMVLKILTVATRKFFYHLSKRVLWEVMNDLIALGVEKNELDDLLDEMVGVRTVRIQQKNCEGGESQDDDNKIVSIQNPALGDIAQEVCTPVQVRSIATALIERLQKSPNHTFQTTLVLADLHNLVEANQGIVKNLWYRGYKSLIQESEGWPEKEINKWKEVIEDEIQALGLSPKSILGTDFHVPSSPSQPMSNYLAMLKVYTAPLALGAIGITWSVICRNIFREYGTFRGAPQAMMDEVRGAVSSACGRFMMETSVLEDYLRDEGLGGCPDVLAAEFEMISFLANTPASVEDVETKAMFIVEEILPRFVEPRIQRLHQLIKKLSERDEPPAVIVNSEDAIRLAYQALQANRIRADAAQDALMILATMNWKPRAVPEQLPVLHPSYQSIPNLRDQTLKQQSETEYSLIRRQQTVDDLEAFLLVTALLSKANEQGMC